MLRSTRLISAATSVALVLGSAGAAFAQTTTTETPAPVTASPMAAPSPMESATTAPTSVPATAVPSASAPTAMPHGNSAAHTNHGKHLGQLKKVESGTLTTAQVTYALTHPLQEAQKLRAMHTIKFSNLRVYRLSSLQKTRLKIGYAQYDAVAQALYGAPQLYASTNMMIAQSNVGGSAMNLLHNVLANVNVSDALNNVLNNSNVNVVANVALSDVLNNVNVGIGQVVGIYIGTGGSVTTIVG